ncbi:HNH endonuclease [Brevibacillus formosus]|uniref:HNH endonuclease n=1 Tax=Brevibacillus formosus TaxID=54913 RepID=UPI0027E4A03E|nr:HNH endonuclease signature motif containing protein [Brevibacillus formosus]
MDYLLGRNYYCVYCGTESEQPYIEIDHFAPSSEGGTYEPPNLVVSCPICHKRLNKVAQPDAISNLSDQEIYVLEELKKYPVFFNDLASDPSKIKKVIKMWEFMKSEFENDNDEEPED